VNFFSAIGTLAYFICWPALAPFLKRTSRAYVIIEHKAEFLVIKNLFGRKQWHLPGGGVKKDESAKLAVIRETWEEVGLQLEPKELTEIASGTWKTDKLGFSYTIFHVKLSEQPDDLDIQKPEVLDAAWLTKAEITKNTPLEIKSALAEA
jgi:8-oxo-dGTP pyrophosphatase MutT (NUDIX family)